jgi:hypothetical protein
MERQLVHIKKIFATWQQPKMLQNWRMRQQQLIKMGTLATRLYWQRVYFLCFYTIGLAPVL